MFNGGVLATTTGVLFHGDGNGILTAYDTDTGEASIRRVAYDIASAQRKIMNAGLPEVLANRLALGV